MTKLYVVLFVSVVLAFLYERTCVSDRGGQQHRFFPWIVAQGAVLIFFCGLRGAYNDTWNYRDVYEYLAEGFPEAWDSFSWKLGSNPAFNLIQAYFKTKDVDVHLFIMFFAFWTLLFYLIFLKKYSVNYALTTYLFFTMGCYVFTMAAIKQCMATGFCLLAIPFALDKKWIRFGILIILGAYFHPYALMYLIVPFMMFRPWTTPSYILLGLFVVGGRMLQPLMGTVIDITTAIGEEYTESTFSGSGVGIMRVLVVSAPLLLSWLYRHELFRDSTKREHLFVNLSMVYAGILFVGMYGTALYFGRLSNYFAIMQTISLPWMLKKIHKPDSTIFTILAVICYMVFFWFSYTVENDFASAYEAISLSRYWGFLMDALH